MGFVDIHTHIIPDVDDGSKSFDDSISALIQLKEIGFDTIIATPHRRSSLFDFDREKIRKNFSELNNLVMMNNLNLRIYLGAEYYFGYDLFDDINNGMVYTLGNSNYILVEFRTLKFSNQDRENIFRILSYGYKIIVAHIERNKFNMDSFSGLDYLRDNSALFQCDIMSLSGLWGENVRLFMEELIKRKYVDIISTDIHCKDFEKDLLIKGFERLREIDDAFLDAHMSENIKKRLGLL